MTDIDIEKDRHTRNDLEKVEWRSNLRGIQIADRKRERGPKEKKYRQRHGKKRWKIDKDTES